LNDLVQLKIESNDEDTQKKIYKQITDLIKVNNRIKYDITKNSILNSLKTNLSKRLDNIEFDISLP